MVAAAVQSAGGTALIAGALLPWSQVRVGIAGSAPRADLDAGIESGIGKAFVGVGAALVAVALLRSLARPPARRALAVLAVMAAGWALVAGLVEASALRNRVDEFSSSVRFLGGEADGAVRAGITVAIVGAGASLLGAVITTRERVGSEQTLTGGSHGSGDG